MDRSVVLRSLLMALPVAVLAACGGEAPDGAPVTSDADAPAAPAPAAPAAPAAAGDLVAQGQAVYAGQGICFTCHGQAGEGTQLGPDLTDDEWLWIENPEENLQAKLVEQIRAGTPEPQEFPSPMPPMGGASLTEEQLQAVAAYVASLSQA